jgi:hypothetical protein
MINWTMIAALAAVVAAGVAVWQTFRTTRIQALLQLLSEWQSPAMLRTRGRAAVALKVNQLPNDDVDDVLDFFETLAVFCKQRVLNEELTWHTFYWPMANYWRKTEGYISEARRDEGDETWKDYSDLVQALIRREGKSPTTNHVEDFLSGEARRGSYYEQVTHSSAGRRQGGDQT